MTMQRQNGVGTNSSAPLTGGVLQRKCACGGTPGPTGECAACKQKREAREGMIQRSATNSEISQRIDPVISGSRFSHEFAAVPTSQIRSRFFQTKLQFGQPQDHFEQEADEMAAWVMRAPLENVSAAQSKVVSHVEIQPQRAVADPLSEEDALDEFFEDDIDDDELDSESEAIYDGAIVQSKTNAATATRASNFESYLDGLNGNGQILPSASRNFYEQRFQHDFSGVRIHTDARAFDAARAISARAFTVGSQIVFGAGQYAPTTSAGQMLLAHELTHVVQQRASQPIVHRSGTQKTTTDRSVQNLDATSRMIQSRQCAFGEIESWGIVSQRDHTAPAGLGDAAESIEAVCARNSVCHCVSEPAESAPSGRRAAWSNISTAQGSDQSGSGDHFCVGTQDCGFVHQCSDLRTGQVRERTTRVRPSGSATVAGKGTLYFYSIGRGHCPPNRRRRRRRHDAPPRQRTRRRR